MNHTLTSNSIFYLSLYIKIKKSRKNIVKKLEKNY